MLSGSRPLLRPAATLLALAGLYACQAAPPAVRVEGPAGTVRAETEKVAAEVSLALAEIEPQVRALLPDARPVELEVWVQESPRLYAFSASSYQEADGFWAEGLGRIHLRESAESLRRTLAHELSHAMLGDSWRGLPGTVEEGLCDWVSARVCPDDAGHMRAGRLSAACFATGGMELEVALLLPQDREGFEVGYTARVLLHGGLEEPIDPMDVFSVRAGLSTTRMEPARKKAYYGLSYLLVDRIAERGGLEALHALCLRSAAEGRKQVPGEWLLRAAAIEPPDARGWRDALGEDFAQEELEELLRMYPDLLIETVERSFGSAALQRAGEPDAQPLRVRITRCEGNAAVELGLAPR